MSEDNKYSLNKFAEVAQRGAHSIFCDEVRQEISGKSIIVGVYGSEVLVPEFPVMLPSFTIITDIWWPQADPFKKLIIRLLLNDEILNEDPIDMNPLSQERFVTNFAGVSKPAVKSNLSRAMAFSPFIVEKPSVLRVRIETESGEMRTKSLTFRQGKKTAEESRGG